MMNKRRFLPVLFVLLISLVALVIVLTLNSDTYPPLAVPIYIGSAPSAPGAVDNDHARLLTSWSSSDLQVKDIGRLTGHITASNGTTMLVVGPYRDVLVVQILAVFAPMQITHLPGDLLPMEWYDRPVISMLSERIPILAQHTTPDSASFQIDVPFRLPHSIGNSGPLKYLEVAMLWARISIYNWQPENIPGYPVSSPAATVTLNPTQVAYFSTAYPVLLTPSANETWTPPPGGYPTVVPSYRVTLLVSGGLVSYNPPAIFFNQKDTSLNGEFDSLVVKSVFGSDLDVDRWLENWAAVHFNLP